MRYKIMVLVVGFVFVLSNLYGQSLSHFVVASSGGYYTSAVGSLSATVAEMTMVQTFSAAGNFLTQGFQQPEEWYASVEEQKTESGISVYPNPSNGQLSVLVNSQENGSVEIFVFNVVGQKIFSKKMNITTGPNIEFIDIRDSSPGIYFLQYLYTGDDGKKDSRIIKINIVY